MLEKFTVKNFKNFTDFTFDLTKTNSYAFNETCVKNGLVNKALVYGRNSVGKSNLGYALFDVVSHVTDNNFTSKEYKNYINAFSDEALAEFSYYFKLGTSRVEYHYGKSDLNTLVYEKILINEEVYAQLDRRQSQIALIKAKGAESLATDFTGSKISIVSYIRANALLQKNITNEAFEAFVSFINGMLFFQSVDRNSYLGFIETADSISSTIIAKGKVKQFEQFLNKNEVQCELGILDLGDSKTIAFVFGEKKIPFPNIASRGTMALAVFYYWYLKLESDGDRAVTFLFIDEFDAYYHHALSAAIIELLKDIKAQTIVTTHNTSLISNELLRPDCYFLMYPERIESLANRTPKILREAHNIEKMYRAGAFNDQ